MCKILKMNLAQNICVNIVQASGNDSLSLMFMTNTCILNRSNKDYVTENVIFPRSITYFGIHLKSIGGTSKQI